MCLILFAWRAHARYPLIVAANRDEWFDRPTLGAHFWADHPEVLAGRDLHADGTWLGITRAGRFAALTNYREGAGPHPAGRSRGALVRDYLVGDDSAPDYAAAAVAAGAQYNGFNLLTAAGDELAFASNRDARPRRVAPGIHGLSNHLLDTPWPKVARGRERLGALLAAPSVTAEQLFRCLADSDPASDTLLPATGVSIEWERALSAAHIRAYARGAAAAGGERYYGTRSATVLLVDVDGRAELIERTFGVDGAIESVSSERFALEPA